MHCDLGRVKKKKCFDIIVHSCSYFPINQFTNQPTNQHLKGQSSATIKHHLYLPLSLIKIPDREDTEYGKSLFDSV